MPKRSRTISSKSQAANGKSAITVKDLTVRYDGPSVIENVSFSVPDGHIAAVLGPNGSGKSTLIKTILGLIKPQSGTIRLFGKDLHEVRRLIGYVPQRFDFDKHFPITVHEFLDLTTHRHQDSSNMMNKLRAVGLSKSILKKRIGTLSGGQLQRVLIAQATLHDPSLLILDEPATGIDIVGEEAFINILKTLNKEQHTTILLVSHDVAMVLRLVDTVVCINKKLMCAGPPKSALTQRKLEDLYGGETHLYEHDHA